MNRIINTYDFELYETGSNKGRVSWADNIGLKVCVEYEGKKYNLKIVGYIRDKNRVVFSYKDITQKPMYIGHFMKCKFGKIFKSNKLIKDEILKTSFLIDYKRCESELNLEKTHIDELSIGTKTKIFVICKKCGEPKKNSLVFYNLYKRGLNCEYCSSKVSYPERYFANLMIQLNEKYKKVKFNWSENREYDAFFEKYNLIVELHGNQHFVKSFTCKGSRTLEGEVSNDRFKKHLAKKNGVKNYIQIDCRFSNADYIKDNIIKSLSWLFDFSNIDWKLIAENVEDSLIFDICSKWNKLDAWERSTTMLSEMFSVSSDTVKNYLIRGTELEWCNYNANIERNKSLSKGRTKKRKPVEIFKDDISLGVFDSLTKLHEESIALVGVNLDIGNMSNVCTGKKSQYKGFTFKYVEDADNQQSA